VVSSGLKTWSKGSGFSDFCVPQYTFVREAFFDPPAPLHVSAFLAPADSRFRG
jgi:hypothetical protein